MQDAGVVEPDRRVAGAPGIVLRRVRSGTRGTPLLPGMGKVFVHADSGPGQELLAYFPAPSRAYAGSVSI